MNWRDVLGGALAGAVLLGGLIGIADRTDVADKLNPASPTSEERSLAVCKKVGFVTRVTSLTETWFEAKHEEPGLRYDLTWRDSSTAIAVEETKGRDFAAWAEQRTPAFDDCVASKPVVQKAAH